MRQNRRNFLKNLTLISAGTAFVPTFVTSLTACINSDDIFFDISLAEWSLNKALFDGKLTNMKFPEVAKNEFGIDAVEYVNQFFSDKAKDKAYLSELNQRCSDLGVKQLLIMVDDEGDLAVTDDTDRQKAIENHYKWIEAANYLGCHSIRVNLFGDGPKSEQKAASVDSLGQVAEFGKDANVNVLVENHGGYSSDAQWLADVMKQVNMDHCGTLPDFGNFCIKREGGARWEAPCIEEYDKYKGVKELMSFAKGVSAKSYGFDENGSETTIDYRKMLRIVHDAGYHGYIGIEYEGGEENGGAYQGIRSTKKLLQRVGKEIAEQ